MNESDTNGASEALDAFEWHDLPVTKISVTERGVELVVTPYVEETDSYRSCCLRIFDAEVLTLDLNGELSLRDLDQLEVSAFDYSIAPSGRMSGTVGILPGSAGYWKVTFANALWSLEHA